MKQSRTRSANRSFHSALAIPVVALGANAVVGGIALTVSGVGRPAVVSELNVVLPLITLVVLSASGVLLLRSSPTVLISGLALFLASCGLYFGLAPLLISVASPDVVAAASELFPLTPEMLLRTNVLNSVCIGGSLAALALLKRAFPAGKRTLARHRGSAGFTVVILGGVAMLLKLTVTMPVFLGWNSSPTMGLVGSFVLSTHALTLYLWYQIASRPKLLILGIGMVGLEAFLGFAILMKSEILIPFVVAGIGYGLGNPRAWRRLLLWGAGVLLLFFLLVPVISGLRKIRWTGQTGARTYSSVAKDLSTVSEVDEFDTREGRRWWFRLYYAVPQAFVMDLHDHGQPGDTYKYAGYLFIPRLLWPEKPHTSPGAEVNFLMTRTYNSATGVGVFAEGYWSFGWVGAGLVSLLVGFVLFAGDRLAHLVVLERRFELLPGLIHIIFTCMTPEGWIVTWTAGPIFCFLFIGVARAVASLAGSQPLVRVA